MEEGVVLVLRDIADGADIANSIRVYNRGRETCR
jgi:hypothetical protein